MQFKLKPAHFLPFVVVLAIWALYLDFGMTIRAANRLSALGGLALAAITFLIGPLSRFYPKLFARHVSERKYLGLSAFALMLIHTVLAIVFSYGLSLEKMVFENPKVIAFYAASGAFLIFLVMSVTSTKKAMEALGYHNWKTLQVAGYAALVLSLAHFFVIRSRPEVGFSVQPIGMAVFALGLVAIAAKLIAVAKSRPKTSFEQHFEHEHAHEHAVASNEAVGAVVQKEGES